jgi:DNA-binding CsgD family transcriptional regulator
MNMIQLTELNPDKLAELIHSMQTPAFSSALIRMLSALCRFDCAVILGYSETRRPVYLFDNVTLKRELLFEKYINGSYQHDPFYRNLMNGLPTGIYSLADLTKKDGFPSEYMRDFYGQTGWQHELGVIIKIDAVRWVVIFMGFIVQDLDIVRAATSQLNRIFSLIESLCIKHWQSEPFLLAQTPIDRPDVRCMIENGMRSFLVEQLTIREQDITQLILQGLDSKQIAERYGITVGTVKNHRKHIFAKLHIESQGRLFGLFLDHIITG